MKHITEVLVHENRCEVVNPYVYSTGDAGMAFIKLHFKYMFEQKSLKGKTLECKYYLTNGQYSVKNITIDEDDSATFPIYYSVFTMAGWHTLSATLIDGKDRFTLDDITIKTKEHKLGDVYTNELVQKVIKDETDSIKALGKSKKDEVISAGNSAVTQVASKKDRLIKELKDNAVQANQEVASTKAGIIKEVTGVKDATLSEVNKHKKELNDTYAKVDAFRADMANKIDAETKEIQALRDRAVNAVLSTKEQGIHAVNTARDKDIQAMKAEIDKYIIENRAKLKGEKGEAADYINATSEEIQALFK